MTRSEKQKTSSIVFDSIGNALGIRFARQHDDRRPTPNELRRHAKAVAGIEGAIPRIPTGDQMNARQPAASRIKDEGADESGADAIVAGIRRKVDVKVGWKPPGQMLQLPVEADIGKRCIACGIDVSADDVADQRSTRGKGDVRQFRPSPDEAAEPALMKGMASRLVGKLLREARLEEDWVQLGCAGAPPRQLGQADDGDCAVRAGFAGRLQAGLPKLCKSWPCKTTDRAVAGL